MSIRFELDMGKWREGKKTTTKPERISMVIFQWICESLSSFLVHDQRCLNWKIGFDFKLRTNREHSGSHMSLCSDIVSI